MKQKLPIVPIEYALSAKPMLFGGFATALSPLKFELDKEVEIGCISSMCE